MFICMNRYQDLLYENMWYLAFWASDTLLSKVFLNSIYFLEIVIISFFSPVEWDSVAYMCYIFIVYSSVVGQAGWFHFLGAIDRAARKVDVQISLWCDIELLGCMYSRSGKAGSWGSYILSSMINFHAYFHCGYTSLRSHLQQIRIPLPYSCETLWMKIDWI